MPGVADQVRKTILKSKQKERKKDMQEILRMVEEDRLHEADERQIEVLSLSLELNKLIGKKDEVQSSNQIDLESIANVLRDTVQNEVQKLVLTTGTASSTSTGQRPAMKHTSLTEISQNNSNVEIHGQMNTETESSQDATEKLQKLRKIKGNG